MRISDWSSDVCSSDLSATGEHDALINAYGTIETAPVVIGVQDFAYMGGSMGMGVGAAFIQGIEEAISRRCPYIIFTAAGGARMQEGILSLMQMPRATVAIQKLHAADRKSTRLNSSH